MPTEGKYVLVDSFQGLYGSVRVQNDPSGGDTDVVPVHHTFESANGGVPYESWLGEDEMVLDGVTVDGVPLVVPVGSMVEEPVKRGPGRPRKEAQ